MKRDIEIKLQQIVGSMANLRELAAMKLPAKISYRLARSMRAIDSEVEAYQDAVVKTRDKYVNNPGARGDELDWKSDTAEREYVKEANELLQEVIVLSVDQIRASDLGVEVKPGILVDCYYLFEDLNDDYEEPASEPPA